MQYAKNIEVSFFFNWSIILQFLTLFFLKKKTFAHFWSLMNRWMAFVSFSHRFSIKGRIYPAILPVENKKVTGRVGSSNFIIAASECYCFCSEHHFDLSFIVKKNPFLCTCSKMLFQGHKLANFVHRKVMF